MIIFTPNTVIRSTEVNSNFDEVSGRLDLVENPVYYNADIGGQNTATTYKAFGLYRELNNGFTKTNSTTLTVQTAGIYFIAFQQLIVGGGANGYLYLYVNGVEKTYTYIIAGSQRDYGNTWLGLLNVGDTIRLYNSHATASCWSGGHSDFSVILVKRT